MSSIAALGTGIVILALFAWIFRSGKASEKAKSQEKQLERIDIASEVRRDVTRDNARSILRRKWVRRDVPDDSAD